MSRFLDDDGQFFLCHLCHKMESAKQAAHRAHSARGLSTSLVVCHDCAERSLCAENAWGIHGEVISYEEEEFDRSRWPGAIPDLLGSQIGQCSNCYAPFVWDRNGWVDYQLSDQAAERLKDELLDLRAKLGR